MHTAREEAPAEYDQHLGRHGFDIVEPAVELGAKKAHVRLDGVVLENADDKHPLRDFVWAYRLAEAFGDPALREPMLREGFDRLRRIREREVSFDVEVSGTTHTIEATLGELFRTDLAQALLLDTHVNLPVVIWSQDEDRSIAIQSAKAVFEDEGITIPSTMTRDQDLKLVAELMQSRLPTPGSLNMSAPVDRAIGILKYTENGVIEDLASADASLRGVTDESVTSFLAFRLDVGEEAARIRWRDIQAFPRNVLSLDT